MKLTKWTDLFIFFIQIKRKLFVNGLHSKKLGNSIAESTTGQHQTHQGQSMSYIGRLSPCKSMVLSKVQCETRTNQIKCKPCNKDMNLGLDFQGWIRPESAHYGTINMIPTGKQLLKACSSHKQCLILLHEHAFCLSKYVKSLTIYAKK